MFPLFEFVFDESKSANRRAEVLSNLEVIYSGLQSVIDEANAALNRTTMRFFYHSFTTKFSQVSSSELQARKKKTSFLFLI